MLRDPVFFDAEGFAPPSDFASNLVQGKSYDDVTGSAHAAYFTPIADRVLTGGADDRLHQELDDSETWAHHDPIRGPFRPVRQRYGAEAFKLALLDAYRGRCAVTGRAVQPTLEAAHIHPVGGLHRLDNGLLPRADVHKLFDAGYLTITPKLTVQVSPSFHRHSPAADEYTGLEGRPSPFLRGRPTAPIRTPSPGTRKRCSRATDMKPGPSAGQALTGGDPGGRLSCSATSGATGQRGHRVRAPQAWW